MDKIEAALAAAKADDLDGIDYVDRGLVSLLAISLMARDAAAYQPLGSGAALTQIDRLSRQTSGAVVRGAMRTLAKYAPMIADDAAEIFLLRREAASLA